MELSSDFGSDAIKQSSSIKYQSSLLHCDIKVTAEHNSAHRNHDYLFSTFAKDQNHHREEFESSADKQVEGAIQDRRESS